MLSYIIRRFFYMIILLWIASIVAFILIQLPPGDYLTIYIHSLRATGQIIGEAEILALEKQYGLDLPLHLQYFKWIWGMLHGDFGRSFEWNTTVSSLLAERLPLTVILSLITISFAYAIAIPIGIYSATHQYSLGDYTFTVVGFAGLATPNFLFALILMFILFKYFGFSVGGLFSPQYLTAPWSIAKFADMLQHLPHIFYICGKERRNQRI